MKSDRLIYDEPDANTVFLYINGKQGFHVDKNILAEQIDLTRFKIISNEIYCKSFTYEELKNILPVMANVVRYDSLFLDFYKTSCLDIVMLLNSACKLAAKKTITLLKDRVFEIITMSDYLSFSKNEELHLDVKYFFAHFEFEMMDWCKRSQYGLGAQLRDKYIDGKWGEIVKLNNGAYELFFCSALFDSMLQMMALLQICGRRIEKIRACDITCNQFKKIISLDNGFRSFHVERYCYYYSEDEKADFNNCILEFVKQSLLLHEMNNEMFKMPSEIEQEIKAILDTRIARSKFFNKAGLLLFASRNDCKSLVYGLPKDCFRSVAKLSYVHD
jgi:hypothetical protein